jgi:hypothetical protein
MHCWFLCLDIGAFGKSICLHRHVLLTVYAYASNEVDNIQYLYVNYSLEVRI